MNSKSENPKQKVCLSIAGLDPSGGAGIIADIKTFTAFGCFAASAVTSLTFQNTCAVFGAEHQTGETVRRQVEPLIDDFEISAVKTGMLPTGEIIDELTRIIETNNLKNYVLDPVVRSTSGFDLIDDPALRRLIEKLFPLSTVITPSLPEAERIAGMKINSEADITKAAAIMRSAGAKNVLIKGGHFYEKDFRDGENKQRKAVDYLFTADKTHVFEAEFLETTATHGTGCTLASAIAANLALGNDLIRSVDTAKKFVTEAIRSAPHLGKGNSPVNHSISGFRL